MFRFSRHWNKLAFLLIKMCRLPDNIEINIHDEKGVYTHLSHNVVWKGEVFGYRIPGVGK